MRVNNTIPFLLKSAIKSAWRLLKTGGTVIGITISSPSILGEGGALCVIFLLRETGRRVRILYLSLRQAGMAATTRWPLLTTGNGS